MSEKDFNKLWFQEDKEFVEEVKTVIRYANVKRE